MKRPARIAKKKIVDKRQNVEALMRGEFWTPRPDLSEKYAEEFGERRDGNYFENADGEIAYVFGDGFPAVVFQSQEELMIQWQWIRFNDGKVPHTD